MIRIVPNRPSAKITSDDMHTTNPPINQRNIIHDINADVFASSHSHQVVPTHTDHSREISSIPNIAENRST
jgi:hypothetical protein